MLMRWLSQGTLLSCLLWLLSHGGAMAQLRPDTTLGAESSTVTPLEAQTVQIDGGAARDSTLFHSFSEFNIDEKQGAYFTSPTNIENIFSRVTGENGSNIFGTLGVLGNANLFLLNPNGIVFGPDARLDIQGSFLATTADSFIFSGGETFSASSPEAPPLLVLNVMPGVQFGGTSQGAITSTSYLEVGQDLTLLANQLYLEGQLRAENDLTLQGQDTVTIRDTPTDAFLAHSGGDLTIQGNQGIDIWTLQHLEQSPFISGGALTLISDGEISGDAHFQSGAGVSFVTLTGDPGTFVSEHDPIILADGDVVFGDYTGASLKVEATGSIRGGNIRITGPDTALIADGSGSDEDLLASGRTAILRAGVNSISSPANTPQSAGGTTFVLAPETTPASIQLSSVDTFSSIGEDGGPIILAADGDLTITGDVSSSSYSEIGDAANGGDIIITSISGNITLEGEVNASSEAFIVGSSSDSGNILISSISGDITTEEKVKALAFSRTENAGNAGEIAVQSASGNVTINNVLETFSSAKMGDSGNGGNISISGDAIAINERLNSFTITDIGVAGDAGDISLTSRTGDILVLASAVPMEELESAGLKSWSISDSGIAGNGGNISLLSISGNIVIDIDLESFSKSETGIAGNGGDIRISSRLGDISTDQILLANSFSEATGTAGDGGNISISSLSGDISTQQRLTTQSFTLAGDAGNGGDISISSLSGDISTNEIDASSFTFPWKDDPNVDESQSIEPTGDGGDISITSVSGDITATGFIGSSSFSRYGDVGRGGNISLTTQEGSLDLEGNTITAIAVSEVDGNTGSGGNVSLQAPIISNTAVLTASSGGVSGDVDIRDFGGGLQLNNLQLTTSGQIQLSNPNNTQTLSLDFSRFEQSGNTIIASSGDLTINNVRLLSDANGAADAGNVKISSSDNLQVNNSEILSNTNIGSSGDGGSIEINSIENIVINNSIVSTDTAGNGRAGNIMINTLGDFLLLRNGSNISTNAGTDGVGGDGGNIEIIIPNGVIVAVPQENSDISANAVTGDGGRVEIDAIQLLGIAMRSQLTPLSDITASSELGTPGTVTSNLSEPTPSAEVTSLPDIPEAEAITQGCLASSGQTGEFFKTGRGGIATSPGEPLEAEDLWRDLRLPAEHSSRGTSPSPNSLVEATGWMVNETGLVDLANRASAERTTGYCALNQALETPQSPYE